MLAAVAFGGKGSWQPEHGRNDGDLAILLKANTEDQGLPEPRANGQRLGQQNAKGCGI